LHRLSGSTASVSQSAAVRMRLPVVRAAVLAVVTVAALVGLCAMHVLPMPMTAAPTAPTAPTGPTSMSMSVDGGHQPAAAATPEGGRGVERGLVSVQPGPTAQQPAQQRSAVLEVAVGRSAWAAASVTPVGCGMDHAGCLATLTPTVRAQAPAEAADLTSIPPTPWAGPTPPSAAELGTCPPRPSLSELCIRRT